MTAPTLPIPITTDELGSICEALRYEAADLETEYTIHRRNEASLLRYIAYELEARYRAAVIEGGRVETMAEEEWE